MTSARHKTHADQTLARMVFPTELGWMAMVGSPRGLRQLTFDHPSAAAAVAALDTDLAEGAVDRDFDSVLVERLQSYAAGARDSFRDVRLDLRGMTPFQRRVVEACRRIEYGHTATYGDLASRAHAPRAARAVGNVMANNRFPLIVPCHRIVAASKQLGGFSARRGPSMKLRLLSMEADSSKRLVVYHGPRPRPIVRAAR